MDSHTEAIAGRYISTDQDMTYSLEIRLDELGSLEGSLSSMTGDRFTITGRMQGGIGVGVCTDEHGGRYFETYIEEELLHFALIEPDERNMPDYDKARRIVFTRQDNAAFSGGIALEHREDDAWEEMAALMSHLSGTWICTTSSKRTVAAFRHDGTYTYRQEGSHAGPSAPYYSDPDAMRDAHEDDAGEWEIRGDRERGVIIIKSDRGGRGKVEYQVRREEGQLRWNKYWFNRELFVKQ